MGKCFICQELGYKINNCPKHIDIKAIKKLKEVLKLKVLENENP